jgi:RNA polymerase sigma-70 factor (ECF subfamily)
MKGRPSLSDKDLIRLYLKGDDKAFNVLFSRYSSRIYTAIYLFVNDTDEANDIFQETFIKIIDTIRKGKYNEEGKFVQWALRIANNLCIDHFRKNKRSKIIKTNDDFDIFDTIPASENQESAIIKEQTYKAVRRVIEELPVEQKEVLMLRMYAELSFKEIAQLTGVSINTALGRMRYALINLKKTVEEKALVLR